MQSSICNYCGEEYTYDSLKEQLEPPTSTYDTIAINDSDSDEIQKQLEMQICANCRIQSSIHDVKKEICTNCLWYGFNHPMNISKKCSKCGKN